jgi:hypothetical protein
MLGRLHIPCFGHVYQPIFFLAAKFRGWIEQETLHFQWWNTGDIKLWLPRHKSTGFPGQDLSFFVQRSALSLQINLHSGLQISIDFYNYFDYFDCFHIKFTSDLLQQFLLDFELPYATAAPAPGSKTCRR